LAQRTSHLAELGEDGMAVTEVNPMTDVRDMTSTLAAYLIFTFAVFGAESSATADG
jgi:arginase family enzyme